MSSMGPIGNRTDSQRSLTGFSSLRRRTSDRKGSGDRQSPTKRRITPEMISFPNNCKHTGHIGPDGAFFGDVSFLGTEFPHLADSHNRDSLSEDQFEPLDLGPSFMEEVFKELNFGADTDKDSSEMVAKQDASQETETTDEVVEADEVLYVEIRHHQASSGEAMASVSADLMKQTRSMSELQDTTPETASIRNEASFSDGTQTPGCYKAKDDFQSDVKRKEKAGKDGKRNASSYAASDDSTDQETSATESPRRCSSDPPSVLLEHTSVKPNVAQRSLKRNSMS